MVSSNTTIRYNTGRSHVPFTEVPQGNILHYHITVSHQGTDVATTTNLTLIFPFHLYIPVDFIPCKGIHATLPWVTAKLLNSSNATWMPHVAFCNHLLHSSALANTTLSFISLILSFQKYYTNGILLRITFWDWLLTLSTIPLGLTQVVR